MEENVALDSSKQKQFVKSIKGIKKLIKKNDAKGASEKISAAKAKDGKIKKKKKTRVPRGLVYLGHIPHGFYEYEMTQYFKQFGKVTNVRVIRSKRTGNSKGFAFVEFQEPAVAEIVAETMNNYLMGKRLIKASYIPPEKQRRHAKRKFWSTTFNPGSEARLEMKKAYNAKKDDQEDLQKARKLLSNITKTKKKLTALGINYDFFSPVDVPESLVTLVSPAEVKQNSKTVKENTKIKKMKDEEVKDVKVKEQKNKKDVVSKQQNNKKAKQEQVKEKIEKKVSVKEETEKKPVVNKKNTKAEPVQVNKKQQAQKEKKLKDAGVKPVENFIKIQQETDDESDSSYDFNSDEFEKMSSDEDVSDGSDDESETGDSEEESDEENPPRLVMAVPPKIVQASKVPKLAKIQDKKQIVAQKKEQKTPQLKQKASQKPAVATKTSKFENKNKQKLVQKQFKKKK